MAFSYEVNPYVLKSNTLPDCLANQGGPEHSWREALLAFQEKKNAYQSHILELGSGSGQHLLERAAQDQSALYTGIEWRYKRAFRTAEKGKKKGLKNIFVFRGDFSSLLQEHFQEESLDGVYMNFPDPWEKRRWKKHRPIALEFLLLLAHRLKTGAFFALKTDHEEYFRSFSEFISEEVQLASTFTIQKMTTDLYAPENAELQELNVLTEFEQLFLFKKKRISYLCLAKNSGQNCHKTSLTS